MEGSGWAILVWVPRSGRLEILQSTLHQLFTQWDTIPLLVLDVWEHAYYLQYQNRKDEYIKNWWNVVNWPDVEKDLKVQNKLNGHRIRRRFSASFYGRRRRFRSYFKRPSIHLYKKCQKDVGKYETNLCNHNASYYLCKRYANSYMQR